MDRTKHYYLTPHLEATARKWLDLQGLPLNDLVPFFTFIEHGAEQVRDELSSHHSFAMRAARVAQENGDEMQYWREYFVSRIPSQMENGDVLKVLDSRVAATEGANQHVPYNLSEEGLSVSDPTSPDFVGVYSPPNPYGTGSSENSSDQTSKELGLKQVSKQPSPQAIEIAARIMAKRAIRRDREDGNF